MLAEAVLEFKVIDDIDLNTKFKMEDEMGLNEDFQARIEQIGPRIDDENVAGFASVILQESRSTVSEGKFLHATSRETRLEDQSYFNMDDPESLSYFGPKVDDEEVSAYMSCAFG